MNTRGRPPRGARRAYACAGRTGCVSLRRSNRTGHLVGVYDAAAAGLESDPETPWAVVCEAHSTLVCVETLTLARDVASDPPSWCETCAEPRGES